MLRRIIYVLVLISSDADEDSGPALWKRSITELRISTSQRRIGKAISFFKKYAQPFGFRKENGDFDETWYVRSDAQYVYLMGFNFMKKIATINIPNVYVGASKIIRWLRTIGYVY